MSSSLTTAGFCWATLSIVAALLCCSGFYLPFWIKGRLLGKWDAYFSSFRRCNYPKVNSQGGLLIVEECARYARFDDIPSVWWQVCTVLMATGCALSVLVAVTASASCCITNVIHNKSARMAGLIQLFSALLVMCGIAVYPLGWDNREVRESCGHQANVYRIGQCEVSWSAYILAASVTLSVICFALSFYASRVKADSFRI